MQAFGILGVLTCYFFSDSLILLPLPLLFILTNIRHSSEDNSRELSFCSDFEQDAIVPPVCVSVSLLDEARRPGTVSFFLSLSFQLLSQHLVDIQ